MTTTTTQATVDFSLITPDMYASVGLNPNHTNFQRQLGDITAIPVTAEQREKLGRIRVKRLRVIKITSFIVVVTSVPSIIVGLLLVTSADNFPYILGGGMIAGIGSLLMAFLALMMVREGRKSPTGDSTTSCFTNYVKGHYICTFFLGQILVSCLGMGGIWGTVVCAKRKPSDDYDRWSFNSCTPNTGTLLTLSVFTVILVGALLIMTLVICCSYCTNMRAFGIKSRYEMLLDLQMARMAEMQQYQRPVPPGNYYQGQGYQPVPQGNQFDAQGQGYPPGPHGQSYQYGAQGQGHAYGAQGQGQPFSPSPSAPPVEKTDDSAPPPSYNEVMYNC